MKELRPLATGLALLVSGIAGAQTHDLIGYWQNWNDGAAPYIQLDEVDPRYSIIEVAFAEPVSPTTYTMDFAPSEVPEATIIAQIAAVKAQGRKVLISIGGANATVQLNSDVQRNNFVTRMMDILTTYGFDGMDIDLEGASVNLTQGTIAAPADAPILRLIAAINTIADQYETATGVRMMLTMAPETAYVQGGQSAFGGIWGGYLPIINALRDRLDVLQVQLYNSGSMYGLDGATYTQGTADFIISQTEAVLQGFSTSGGFFAPLPPEKVAVGLPACPSAAGGGYTEPTVVAAAINYLRGDGPQPGSYTRISTYPTLRGLMTWSINWDAVSTCNNNAYEFAQNYEDIFGLSTGISPSVNVNEAHPWPSIIHAGQWLQLGHPDRVTSLHDALGRSIDGWTVQSGILQTPATLGTGRYWVRSVSADGSAHCASFVIE